MRTVLWNFHLSLDTGSGGVGGGRGWKMGVRLGDGSPWIRSRGAAEFAEGEPQFRRLRSSDLSSPKWSSSETVSGVARSGGWGRPHWQPQSDPGRRLHLQLETCQGAGQGALRFRGLSSIFLPDSLILFTSAGLAGQTDAVIQQVSWPTANCITHPLCVGTILGALGIARSRLPLPSGAHILLGRESVSRKPTGKCTKHSVHLSQSWDREQQQQQNTEQEVWDARTLPPDHCAGLRGFRVRGVRRPPSTGARKHVHAHTYARTCACTHVHACALTRTHTCAYAQPSPTTSTFHVVDLGTQFGGLMISGRTGCLRCGIGVALPFLSVPSPPEASRVTTPPLIGQLRKWRRGKAR